MRAAESLLIELGIDDPIDIELEAIAHCVGASVEYRDLTNSEAQIIGYRDRAVIYVRRDARFHRKRFSTGHELGHWHHHRGQSFICKPTDIGLVIDEQSRNAERLADSYAADLILPPFMLRARFGENEEITFEAIEKISKQFNASLTATAIRLMRMTRTRCILVAHSLFGRRWQWPSITVGRLKARDDIDTRSIAFASMQKPGRISSIRKEPAHYWFDRRHIDQFDVFIQTMQTIDGEALSLITIREPRMVEIYG